MSPVNEKQSEKTNEKNSIEHSITSLLRHYEPGLSIPPSARIGDPKLKQKETVPLRLWQLWKYGAFAATKAIEISGAILSHNIRGPPRPSWGIEMTLLSCLMRDAHHHSSLADIASIRLAMSLSGLVPVPSDALVTPVTFRVRRRKLRGILAEFDAAENGTRELAGEWVVGNRTWQRLQREWKAAKRARERSDPQFAQNGSHRRDTQKRRERVILYLHGGAYYTSSPASHRLITIPLSKALDARLFALDYRLAPETRFPGPLHDAVSAYFRMVNDLHISPSNIIVAGDSAGGGLCLALMMYLRDNKYPLPGGAVLMSPWVDLTMSCDSWESNAQYDIVPMPMPGDHLNPIACYLGEHMEKYLTHPYASPLFGDLKGLPPMLIQAGEVEVLRDEITLLAHKATMAGVEVRHELYEDAVHVFQTLPFLDSARRAFLSAREFVRDVLSNVGSDSIQELEGKAEEVLEHEINNDSARVVKGDGTECQTSSTKDIPEPPSDDDASGSESKGVEALDEEPSWVTPQASPPTSEDEGENSNNNNFGSSSGSAEKSSSSRLPTVSSPQVPHASTRRNSSAAAVLPPPTSPRRRKSYTQMAHSHSKDTSAPLPSSPRSPLSSRAPTRQSSREFQHHHQHRMSTVSMSSSSGSAPRPGIRRSHTSHPDITSLCQQWANSGPANQTLTYKPESGMGGPRRRPSMTFSLTSSTVPSSPVVPKKSLP
ncbi:hypothetical protein QCA50_010326 [Cerrena zonata]|uniref:Alpha/beta hydrolase fold-3 domain-containing protein n=1 Tax=Cerrena zonata TaxID=2478898 RepID=A0AAW0G126_9APHY